MEEKFKVGDTVKLKSGGPVMTVNEIGTRLKNLRGDSEFSGQIKCIWFNNGSLNQKSFSQDALEAVEKEDNEVS